MGDYRAFLCVCGKNVAQESVARGFLVTIQHDIYC